MSYVDQVVTLLTNDATLAALLTGKIWFFGDLGRKGINREITPEVFDTEGILKPLCLVMPMDEHPTFEGVDMPSGMMTTETPVITWVLQDGASGYDTIEAAYNRMYTLLHGYRLTDGMQVLWKKATKNQRSWLAQDASDYEVIWACYGWRQS
jgi:hypothetical protein